MLPLGLLSLPGISLPSSSPLKPSLINMTKFQNSENLPSLSFEEVAARGSTLRWSIWVILLSFGCWIEQEKKLSLGFCQFQLARLACLIHLCLLKGWGLYLTYRHLKLIIQSSFPLVHLALLSSSQSIFARLFYLQISSRYFKALLTDYWSRRKVSEPDQG